MLPLIQYSIYTIIGIITGVSMGTVGIGAGIISIPLLIYSGLSPQSAVGVSLVMQLLPQSLPGVIIYNNLGHIPYIPALLVVLGSTLGIIIGALAVSNNLVTEKMMYKIISIILIISAICFSKQYLFI
jgi:uncharacterized membrane protein YfcA